MLRIAAVICRNHDKVARANLGKHTAQPFVKLQQRICIPSRVAPVPVQHVKVNQVHKLQSVKAALIFAPCRLHARRIARRVVGARYAAMREYVLNLAYCNHVHARALDYVQHRVARHHRRKVAPVARAHKRARLAHKGPRNHAPYAQLAREHLARSLAYVPKLLVRHDRFVRRNLKYAVG